MADSDTTILDLVSLPQVHEQQHQQQLQHQAHQASLQQASHQASLQQASHQASLQGSHQASLQSHQASLQHHHQGMHQGHQHSQHRPRDDDDYNRQPHEEDDEEEDQGEDDDHDHNANEKVRRISYREPYIRTILDEAVNRSVTHHMSFKVEHEALLEKLKAAYAAHGKREQAQLLTLDKVCSCLRKYVRRPKKDGVPAVRRRGPKVKTILDQHKKKSKVTMKTARAAHTSQFYARHQNDVTNNGKVSIDKLSAEAAAEWNTFSTEQKEGYRKQAMIKAAETKQKLRVSSRKGFDTLLGRMIDLLNDVAGNTTSVLPDDHELIFAFGAVVRDRQGAIISQKSLFFPHTSAQNQSVSAQLSGMSSSSSSSIAGDDLAPPSPSSSSMDMDSIDEPDKLVEKLMTKIKKLPRMRNLPADAQGVKPAARLDNAEARRGDEEVKEETSANNEEVNLGQFNNFLPLLGNGGNGQIALSPEELANMMSIIAQAQRNVANRRGEDGGSEEAPVVETPTAEAMEVDAAADAAAVAEAAAAVLSASAASAHSVQQQMSAQPPQVMEQQQVQQAPVSQPGDDVESRKRGRDEPDMVGPNKEHKTDGRMDARTE